LSDCAEKTKDVDLLTEYVRTALARTISKQYADDAERLWCFTLDQSLEEIIEGHLEQGDESGLNTLPPQTAHEVISAIGRVAAEFADANRPAVLLCNPAIRLAVRRLIEPSLPHVAVLGYGDIVPSISIETTG